MSASLSRRRSRSSAAGLGRLAILLVRAFFTGDRRVDPLLPARARLRAAVARVARDNVVWRRRLPRDERRRDGARLAAEARRAEADALRGRDPGALRAPFRLRAVALRLAIVAVLCQCAGYTVAPRGWRPGNQSA
jgi:hypothetical protein